VTTRRGSLRAVAADEKPATEKSKPKTVSGAAEGGDRRELLVAMRARVAKAVEDPNTPARDLAALTRRLLEIAKEIEAIDVAAEEDSGNAEPTADEQWDSSAI
jgi:hypothetical protein